jgi:proteic killer suppression protein
MIKNFKYKGLKDFFSQGIAKGVALGHVKKLRLILTKLNSMVRLADMNYPGSGLHSLKGDKKNFYSVHVNGNWRVIFKFEDMHVFDVDYLDYH